MAQASSAPRAPITDRAANVQRVGADDLDNFINALNNMRARMNPGGGYQIGLTGPGGQQAADIVPTNMTDANEFLAKLLMHYYGVPY